MRAAMALLTLVCLIPCTPTSARGRAPVADQKTVSVISSTVTEVVRLRYADAPTTAQRLRAHQVVKPNGVSAGAGLPAGIEGIVADALTNSLIITGDPDAIAAVKKRIEGLDVQARSVLIRMKVLRFDFDAAGNWGVELVSSPAITTLDNVAASIGIQGDGNSFTAELTPHLNADGTVSVEGGLRANGQRSTFRRQVAARTKAILTGVADSPSAAIRKAAAAGRIPTPKGEPFTVLYLQLVSVEETTGRR